MIQTTNEPDRFEAALLDSVAGRLFAAAAGTLRRAWASAATRRWSTPASEKWRLLPPAIRIRVLAVVAASAMLTDRAAQLATARPADPFSWGVPAVVLAVSLVAAVFSEALARLYARVRR